MSKIESSNGIVEEIRRFIAAEFLLDDHTNGLKDTDLLFEGGIIDSAGAITLVLHLETCYGIRITDDELFPENFATIELIGRFVEQKRQLANSSVTRSNDT
ncbi:MAG: acyl carrier protein [Candidatus Zixiibacteriota bacterium]|nr:MAG: acyl carrier protein [candidate division Zixibacteria bacterium]